MSPSITISVPTIKADSREARCGTVEASSSALPKRPSGTWFWICAAVLSRGGRVQTQLAVQRRADRAGADYVHAHALRQPFGRQRPGQRDQRGLAALARGFAAKARRAGGAAHRRPARIEHALCRLAWRSRGRALAWWLEQFAPPRLAKRLVDGIDAFAGGGS
jgi:hypothetical protein